MYPWISTKDTLYIQLYFDFPQAISSKEVFQNADNCVCSFPHIYTLIDLVIYLPLNPSQNPPKMAQFRAILKYMEPG